MDNIRSYGNPPYRVAVVHGGPGAAGEMAPVARELALDFGVIEPFQTNDSVDGQIEELAAVLKSHSSLPAKLIGFSWGAWLGLLTAARHPEIAAKIILISCPPLEERFTLSIMRTRMERLGAVERGQVGQIRAALDDSLVGGKDRLMCRMGEIFSKADAFDPLPSKDEPVECWWDIFEKVWPEATALRRSGGLLERVKTVVCPVVAVHGDYDPHPAAGVQEPLDRVLADFRFILLDKCGHTPWKERQARDEFFRMLRAELKSSFWTK